MKGYLDVKELESYKKADIQKLARDLGVSDAGTIKEIAARCAAVEIETGAGEPPAEPGKAAGEQAEERTGQQTGDGAAEQAGEAETDGQQTGSGAGDTAGAPQTGQEAAEITRDTEKAQEEAGKAAGGVKVEVVARYLDQQFNQIKEAGEVFTVDRERAAVLVHEKVVKIRE